MLRRHSRSRELSEAPRNTCALAHCANDMFVPDEVCVKQESQILTNPAQFAKKKPYCHRATVRFRETGN
jgi:hypothetical protein